MHKYAIQITIADSRDGACSSSTLKEASSWGKVDILKEQMLLPMFKKKVKMFRIMLVF